MDQTISQLPVLGESCEGCEGSQSLGHSQWRGFYFAALQDRRGCLARLSPRRRAIHVPAGPSPLRVAEGLETCKSKIQNEENGATSEEAAPSDSQSENLTRVRPSSRGG